MELILREFDLNNYNGYYPDEHRTYYSSSSRPIKKWFVRRLAKLIIYLNK